ncbi:MAG TPA: NosD domain-containing protein [bacterium]|nr:NosD domain-containing protein [bacterium]HPN42124.1 NosD domain-containing protein [bacterium]
MITLFSCTKNLTDAETFIISGLVTLDAESDFSDITVALYAPVTPDTAIANTYKRFPAVGFELTQAVLFDHRQANPVYTTKTDKEGKYNFSGLPGGEYNLVALKEGFGWRYLYNINNNTQPEAIKLLPEIEVQGTLDLYTIWDAYQHVIVKGDVIVPDGGLLMIDKGVVVRFFGYYGFEVRGQIKTNGDAVSFIVFTGSTLMNETLVWNGIRFSGTDNLTFNYIKLGNSTTGISFKDAKNIQFNNSYLFKNKYEAFSASQCNNVNFTNNICVDNEKGLFIQSCESVLVEKNIFIDNKEGFENEATAAQIKNNYLANSEVGLHVQFRPSPIIQNNQFSNNGKGMFCAGSDPEVVNNNFYKNIQAINLGIEYNSTDSQPPVNHNNFLANDYTFFINGYPGSTNIKDIDGKNNYWGTVIIEDITRLIWDKYDITTLPLYIGEVFYQPFENLLFLLLVFKVIVEIITVIIP